MVSQPNDDEGSLVDILLMRRWNFFWNCDSRVADKKCESWKFQDNNLSVRTRLSRFSNNNRRFDSEMPFFSFSFGGRILIQLATFCNRIVRYYLGFGGAPMIPFQEL